MKDFITYFKMIKFEHSIFALPFALTSMVLAAGGIPSLRVILWIIVAMIAARSAAMGINRYIDADIDKLNPRTENRHLPANLITKPKTLVFIIASITIFILAAAMLNRLAFILSPLPIIIFIIYAYSKRFTTLCHIILGVSLALAPLGAWIAVTGTISMIPILLSVAVLFWSAGFDILYAIQDIEFDKKSHLHSIPESLGIKTSLRLAKLFHVITFIFLILIWYFNPHLGYIYIIGTIIIGGFMIYEHTLISATDLSKLDKAFFNINAYISMTLAIFTILDILV